MIHRNTAILLAAALAAGCAHQAKPTKPTTEPIATAQPPTAPPSAQDVVQQKLAQRLDRFTSSGEALADVIDRLRDQTGLNIYVNWRALELMRVTRTLPVTVRLANVTVAEALDAVLRTISAEAIPPLGYLIDDDVVTISSRDDLSRNTITRVYDIRGALVNPNDRAGDIARVIRRVQGLDPLSWRDAGGTTGSVRELSGQLIITQTPENQRRIAEELSDVLPKDRPSYPLLSSPVAHR